MQFSTPRTSIAMMLMISFAAVLHLTAMTLRDAEFRALTNSYGLNVQDIIAYTCSTLFDAVLIFGLLTGAGLLTDWGRFMMIAS